MFPPDKPTLRRNVRFRNPAAQPMKGINMNARTIVVTPVPSTQVAVTQVTSDALVKGMKVRATGLFGRGPREATIHDGKKSGVIRCIAIAPTNGHFPDIGDTYIDEITHVEHPSRPGVFVPFVLTEKHARQMKKIRAAGW